ncbi:ankyrin repeat containing protein [Three spot gourami iridovirus]|nr:ankyrin repeat containing protein [South American cichlid iridovirus]AVR29885.1 ankyrin repeat containing protein [Three spot gourami iridovirus]
MLQQQPCEPCVDQAEVPVTPVGGTLIDLTMAPDNMDALRTMLSSMLPDELAGALRTGGSNGQSILFDAIRSGTITAFTGVHADIVNTVREHNTGNTLLMAAVMTRDLLIIKHVVENLGYNTFMGMRPSDHATALHLVACLADPYHGCVRYLLTQYGAQMAPALTMTTREDDMNPLHYACKYGGVQTVVLLATLMSQYDGFTQACFALNAGLAQPALLAVHYDELGGAQKAFILDSVAPLKDTWNGHNVARLIRGDHNLTWFLMARNNKDFFA